MPRLSRRGFIALGGSGSAAVALAACGAAAEPREGDDDPELLNGAMAAEQALQAEYDNLSLGAKGADLNRELHDDVSARINELGRLGASIDTGTSDSDDAIAAQSAGIAAYRQLARLGSTAELRAAGTKFLAQVAAEQASLRDLAGEKVVPYAFVTGLDEPPLEYPDDATSETTSTTTTSSSTSSTTTEGE